MSPTQAPTRTDELVDGIHRISTTIEYEDGLVFQFNQFLIDDERPALIHTGTRCTTASATRSPRCSTRPGSSMWRCSISRRTSAAGSTASSREHRTPPLPAAR